MIVLGRRALLRGMGAVGAAAFIPGCSGSETPAASARFFERIGKPIGIQLYALVGQDPVEDPAALFAQVRDMGFGEMELPNLLGHEPAALKAAADAAGIPISSLHVPAKAFDLTGDGLVFGDNPGAVADAAEALGVTNVVIPFPVLPDDFRVEEGEGFPQAIGRTFEEATLEHWQASAELFNQLGSAMRDRGITLGYHNHNLEFAPLGDTTAWDVLMAETDPDLLKIQLDLGWVAQAGLDPVTTLEGLSGRVVSLHVKDIAADSGQSFYFGMSPTEVGSGTLDWASILPAAEAAGVSHYFVEQEPPFAMPREEAMAQSLAYLQNLEA